MEINILSLVQNLSSLVLFLIILSIVFVCLFVGLLVKLWFMTNDVSDISKKMGSLLERCKISELSSSTEKREPGPSRDNS